MKKQKVSIQKLERAKVDVKTIKLSIQSDEANPVPSVDEVQRKKRFWQRGNKFIKFGFWDKRKLALSPEKSFIIHMMFANGTSKIFVIKTRGYSFEMKKKTYFLIYEESWFNLSLNQYELFYHENYVVPINREVQQLGNEAYFNVTPENAKEIIDFEYVKVLAGANNISNSMRLIMILVIINLAATILMMLMQFRGSG